MAGLKAQVKQDDAPIRKEDITPAANSSTAGPATSRCREQHMFSVRSVPARHRMYLPAEPCRQVDTERRDVDAGKRAAPL